MNGKSEWELGGGGGGVNVRRLWYGMDIFENHPFSTKANSENTGYICSL